MATLVREEAIDRRLPRGADLPCQDGKPLETGWHRAAMTLLIEMLQHHFQGRRDRYVDGNLFVYFDPDQEKKHNFCGPDFFVVNGAQGNRVRESWVIWEEGGVRPAYAIELASKTTKSFDVNDKKDIYEQQLKTPEYVVYDHRIEELLGWRLDDRGGYQALGLNERGWLWSEQLRAIVKSSAWA